LKEQIWHTADIVLGRIHCEGCQLLAEVKLSFFNCYSISMQDPIH